MPNTEENPAAVSLQPLSRDNWTECTELRVAEDQRDFVDSNLYCIAGCTVQPQWKPGTIHAGATMVGIVVFGALGGGNGVIHHLMIAIDHQGHGYGHAAMLDVIEWFRAQPTRWHVRLSYWPGNPAVRLYERLGFEHPGEYWDDEPVMRLVEGATAQLRLLGE